MKNLIWLAFVMFVITACTSSKITSFWKAGNEPATNYKKILVIGLIRDADRTIRENMEEHLAADLQSRGYETICASKAYGPKTFEGLSEEAALQKIASSGAEAVLTIVLLDKEKERRYVPGALNYSPYGYYYNRLWGYYGVMYRRIYEQGYYVINTRYFWESNLYDVKTQRLLYSVQTQSFDPATSESLGHEYGQLIVRNMAKNGVLKDVVPKPF